MGTDSQGLKLTTIGHDGSAAPALVLPAGSVGHMSTEWVVPSEKVRIGAGTALKFGFFAAFGVLLFYLVLSIILGVVAFILAVSGAVDINTLLPGRFFV